MHVLPWTLVLAMFTLGALPTFPFRVKSTNDVALKAGGVLKSNSVTLATRRTCGTFKCNANFCGRHGVHEYGDAAPLKHTNGKPNPEPISGDACKEHLHTDRCCKEVYEGGVTILRKQTRFGPNWTDKMRTDEICESCKRIESSGDESTGAVAVDWADWNLSEDELPLSDRFGKKLHWGDTLGTGGFGSVKILRNTSWLGLKRGPKYAGKIIPRNKQHKVAQEVELQKECGGNDHIVEIVASKIVDHNMVANGDCQAGDCKEGDWLIVMEVVPDGDLFDKRLKRSQAWFQVWAKSIFQQLVKGVQHMHQKGVAHRDLKPENIFCDETEVPPRVKIGDFGLAARFKKVLPDGELADLGLLLTSTAGTLQFMAPEVLSASEDKPYHGPEADVWSLGVILYWLLMGREPWECTNDFGDWVVSCPQVQLEQLKQQILNAPDRAFMKKLSRLSRVAAPEASNLIAHMVDKNVSRRWNIEQVANHPWVTGTRGKTAAVQDRWDRWVLGPHSTARLAAQALRRSRKSAEQRHAGRALVSGVQPVAQARWADWSTD